MVISQAELWKTLFSYRPRENLESFRPDGKANLRNENRGGRRGTDKGNRKAHKK